MCFYLNTVPDLRWCYGLSTPGRQGRGCFVPRLAGTRGQQRSPCSFHRMQESKRIKSPLADHIYFII